MVWAYDYLLSCPGVLFLNYPVYRGIEAVVSLTILYPRINVLVKDSNVRVVGSIPSIFNGERIRRICMDLVKGIEQTYDFLTETVKYSMYYGGLNIYLNYDGEPLILDSEIIDDKSIRIYYMEKGLTIKGSRRSGIDDWLVFATALRLGRFDLLLKVCGNIGYIEDGDICRIDTPTTILLFSNRDLGINGYKRLVVDNNGLRNVVKAG